MSDTIAVDDVIRDWIKANALPAYSPAVFFDDTRAPFTLDNPILLVVADGQPRDGVVNVNYVTVALYSKLRPTLLDMKNLKQDALNCRSALYNQIDFASGAVKISHQTTDVSRASITEQGRYLIKFTLRVESGIIAL